MLKTFESLINTGVEALEMVADAEKKAMICAELAKAIAMSGALKMDGGVEVAEVEVVEEKKKAPAKKSAKKEALKPEASKGTPEVPEEPVTEVPEEPVAEEPVAPAEEPIMEDEWTEEMQTLKAEQLELLAAYVEAWGQDYVYGDCLSAMTEGQLTGGENVRPSNIDGFLAYLNALAQSAQ